MADTSNKFPSAQPSLSDNATQRLMACIAAGGPISEIENAAIRVCRYKDYLEEDLQDAEDDLEHAKKQSKLTWKTP